VDELLEQALDAPDENSPHRHRPPQPRPGISWSCSSRCGIVFRPED
jgi:hypothetical protein